MKLGLKSLWKPVKVQFGATIDKLERLTEDVDKEADLAEKEEASLARSNAEAHVQCKQGLYLRKLRFHHRFKQTVRLPSGILIH